MAGYLILIIYQMLLIVGNYEASKTRFYSAAFGRTLPLCRTPPLVDNGPLAVVARFARYPSPVSSSRRVASCHWSSSDRSRWIVWKRPRQTRDNVLGGSAVFFSYAASYFTSVRLAGVVGEDWPAEHTALLRERHIDTEGLQVVQGGQTFRWRGRYLDNMNDRETLDLRLNVLEQFDPVLPESYTRCKFLFLANGSPLLQCACWTSVPAPS